jgi:hypothetical protein
MRSERRPYPDVSGTAAIRPRQTVTAGGRQRWHADCSKSSPKKMLRKKMLQHATRHLALHNIVCLTSPMPSLMMVSAIFQG